MDNETLYNVNICRICQTPSTEKTVLTDISEKSDEGRSYWDTLKYIFEDIVWVEDSLKSLACEICLKTINDIAEFKSLCLETNYQRLCLQLRRKNVKVVKLNTLSDHAVDKTIVKNSKPKLDNVEKRTSLNDGLPKVDVASEWRQVFDVGRRKRLASDNTSKVKVSPEYQKVTDVTKKKVAKSSLPIHKVSVIEVRPKWLPQTDIRDAQIGKASAQEPDVPPDWQQVKIKEEMDIDIGETELQNEIPMKNEVVLPELIEHVKVEEMQLDESELTKENDNIPEVTATKLVPLQEDTSKSNDIHSDNIIQAVVKPLEEKVLSQVPEKTVPPQLPEESLPQPLLEVTVKQERKDSIEETNKTPVNTLKKKPRTTVPPLAPMQRPIVPTEQNPSTASKRKRKDNLSETVRQRNETSEVSFSEYDYLTTTQWYKCHICKKEFDQLDTLERHVYTHNGTRKYSCHICGRMYVTQSDLLIHSKIHSEFQYECRICPNKRFKTLDSLRKHNIMLMHMVAHSKIKPFKPDKVLPIRRVKPKQSVRARVKVLEPGLPRSGLGFGANVTFPLLQKIEEGVDKEDSETNKMEKEYKCTLCNVQFYKRRTLDIHLRRHRYQCQLCDQKFMKRFYIKVHLKVIHNMDVDETEAKKFYYEVKEDSAYRENSAVDVVEAKESEDCDEQVES